MARGLRWWTVTRRRGRLTSLLAAALALSLAGACSSPTTASWNGPGGATPSPTSKGLRIVYSHEDRVQDVSPGEPVSVRADDGVLNSVTLTSNAGEVQGMLLEDKSAWRSTQDLDYGTEYTLEVKGTGVDGKDVDETRHFTTVSVKVGFYWNVNLNTSSSYYGVPLDGGTFGVGQPIVARFDDAVDKKVAEQSLTVTTQPHVDGAWHWMSDREAHWRPQTYWAPGTTVTVDAKVLGVEMSTPDGRVLHGQETKKATFKIGSSHVAKVDDNTKHMLVYVDGQQVKDFPVSLGSHAGYTDSTGVFHDLRTTSGTMVVTEKHDPVLMKPDLPEKDPAYYHVEVNLAVRITDSGIYVHSAPWSVGDQGYRDVSHGCVNVAPDNAQWFYNTFDTGDVVEVANTGVNVEIRDGLGDWNVPWEQWLKGSALA
jgi:lipoprotein-anchoring transpeptidase ErfK/SrfK